MNYLRTLIAVLFCAMILPANAQDKDCFADLENELSSILKKDSKSSRILKIGSKSSRIPRKVVRWNREKICKQFNMIFANMCQSDFISSDTIIVVRKSQEYLYIGEDKAFFAVKWAHLQSSVFKLSKDLIDSIHEEGIVAYTS